MEQEGTSDPAQPPCSSGRPEAQGWPQLVPGGARSGGRSPGPQAAQTTSLPTQVRGGSSELALDTVPAQPSPPHPGQEGSKLGSARGLTSSLPTLTHRFNSSIPTVSNHAPRCMFVCWGGVQGPGRIRAEMS